jgi:hypothetical protein
MSDLAAATGNLRRDRCVGSVDPSGVWVDRWDVPNKTLTFNFVTDPVGVIALSLSPEGPFTSSLSVTVTTDANGSGRTPFYIKSIATGTAILDGPCSEEYGWVCVAYYDTDGTKYPGLEYRVATITSVVLAPLNSPLGTNDNLGGGRSIFPGRQTPTDEIDRRTVKVEATTTMPNGMVYFKSFDVDDPSTDAAPVDMTGPNGGDNRGTPKPGTLSADSATADASGTAVVTFAVTQHPGDNFRIAASCEMGYLNGVTIDKTDLRDSDGTRLPTSQGAATEMLTVWRRFHIELDAMAPIAGNLVKGQIDKATERKNQTVLTVSNLTANNVSLRSLADGGRNGRFENGMITIFNGPIGGQEYAVATNGTNTITLNTSIGSVAQGTLFWLVDDDNYDGDLFLGDEGDALIPSSAVFSLMQDAADASTNVFAPAYIRPTYDEAGILPSDDHDGGPPNGIAFDLNVTDGEAPIQISLGMDSGGNERDDYWVVYIQLGYQGDERYDKDPLVEHGLFPGVTPLFSRKDVGNDATSATDVPRGGGGSLIFLEDLKESPPIERAPTAPHEVGHQFGLLGHAPGCGMMSSTMVGEPLAFVPAHLNVLRWRVKSPGQP